MIEFARKAFPELFISQELEEDLQKMSIVLELDEGHSLLQPRQSLQSVYFVKNGVIRSSVKKVQTEFTNWFYGKGDMMIAAESFYLDKESGLLWEASCTSQIIEIKKKTSFFYLRNIQLLNI